MSGWGPADWAAALFAAGLILAGVSALARRPEAGGPWWDINRFNGIMMIVVALINLRDPSAVSREPWFLIGFGILALALASWSLLVEPRLHARRLERYRAQLSALALSEDDYSESLRAFHANEPAPAAPRRRLIGAVFLSLFGGAFLALGLSITR